MRPWHQPAAPHLLLLLPLLLLLWSSLLLQPRLPAAAQQQQVLAAEDIQLKGDNTAALHVYVRQLQRKATRSAPVAFTLPRELSACFAASRAPAAGTSRLTPHSRSSQYRAGCRQGAAAQLLVAPGRDTAGGIQPA